MKTLVIGAGPGGYVAAIRAAELGQEVTVVEKNRVGGVCLNEGCIPSKALYQVAQQFYNANHTDCTIGIETHEATLHFDKTQKWKEGIVTQLTAGVQFLFNKHHIQLLEGTATLRDSHHATVTLKAGTTEELSFDHVIIATGSRPIMLADFPKSPRVLDSTGLMNLPQLPDHLVVIGGGVVGSELATVYHRLGSRVTIIESTAHLLSMFDDDMSAIIEERMQNVGKTIIKKATVTACKEEEDGLVLTYQTANGVQTCQASHVLVAIGRTPNVEDLGLEHTKVTLSNHHIVVDKQCKTQDPAIFAIGDVIEGIPLAPKASYEGKVAAEAISGYDVVRDYKALPSVAIVEPEIATTGLQLQEIDNRDDYVISKVPLSANGRALSLNETNGFVRVICDKKTGQIVGGQIVAPQASHLITELTLAIEAGMTAEDVALIIHPHPSLSEAIMDACDEITGYPINE